MSNEALIWVLKAGVFEDRANGYAIGDYKKRANTVGGLKVALPNEVKKMMDELFSWYRSVSDVTLWILAEFHAKYELIHPFQDGNGRTGRMILFSLRKSRRHIRSSMSFSK